MINSNDHAAFCNMSIYIITYAAECGYVKILKWIQRVTRLTMRRADLIGAVAFGHYNIIRAVIRQELHLDGVHLYHHKLLELILRHACLLGQFKITGLIIRAAFKNQRDPQFKSVLELAASRGHVRIIRLIALSAEKFGLPIMKLAPVVAMRYAAVGNYIAAMKYLQKLIERLEVPIGTLRWCEISVGYDLAVDSAAGRGHTKCVKMLDKWRRKWAAHN